MIIVDATNMIIGRLASYVAREALEGKEVRIINSEKAILVGKKKNVFDEYLHMRERGTPARGPFIHRMPEKILKRTIRGMIPYKKSKGKEAYKRILCYVGVPDEFKDKKAVTFKSADVSKLPNLNYIDLKTLSKRLGAKIE